MNYAGARHPDASGERGVPVDIIVTTPRREMKAAAQEAAECLAEGGGDYFRRFARGQAPRVEPNDRVYYVEDGYVRGFAVVSYTEYRPDLPMPCATTRRTWPPGFYVFMRADSWQWIRPIPMKGFRGFRYVGHPDRPGHTERLWTGSAWAAVEVVGNWRDRRPAVPARKDES